MNKLSAIILASFLLAGCDGNPFSTDDVIIDDETDIIDDDDDGNPIASDRVLPPGTSSPTPQTGIFRREARGTGAFHGNGYANNISYDSDSDTFHVQGLAFDDIQPQGTPYNRAAGVNLGTRFAAYEAPAFVPDDITEAPIGQYQHRAIYGVSASGDTELAIVRTGSYTGYGFGGFIYQRNNDVVLPTQGQAVYTGQYAGLRDFNGAGGLEYTTGNMEVSIDFGGFSDNCTGARCTDAVRGYVRDRQVYDLAGTNITSGILDAINAEDNANLIQLPTLVFAVGPGVMDANGEITGTVDSTFTDNEGRTIRLDNGNYYAIMSGDHTSGAGGEIVGIIVVESSDRRNEGVTVRETGGFIVDR